MAARKVAKFEVNRLYRFKKPTILDDNLRSRLPEAYKKFYTEWKMSVPSPVHYIPRKEKWERKESGEVKPVQNFPILPRYPPESNLGLWGGEGVVEGYVKREGKFSLRVPHFWFPALKRSVVYSEILDKHMAIVLTSRTIDLILDNYGLDHYLLKTKACDIQSELGVKLKRKMLLALLNKDLYKNDPEKQEKVYNKYKHYLDDYTKEEIEWYGLTMREALIKLEIDEEATPPQPMKHELRKKLIEELKMQIISELEATSLTKEESGSSSKKSWMSKINPFSSNQKET